MVITRSGGIVLITALAIGATACGKDDAAAKSADQKKQDPAPAEKTPPQAAPATPPAPPAPPRKRFAKPADNADLALLPVDSEIIAGINVAQVQQSALWKEHALPLIESQATFKAIKTACGFDPFQTITSISAGLKHMTTTPEVIAVVHGLDKAKMMGPCLAKMKAELAKEKAKLAVDGGVVTVTGERPGDQLAFTFTDDHTLVGVLGPAGTKAGVLDAAKGGSKLAEAPAFIDMYSSIDTSASIWGLANGNSHAFDKLEAFVKPQAMYGSINMTDAVAVDLWMRVDSEEQARQIAGMGKSQQAATKQYFQRADVGSDGSDVHIELAANAAQVKAIRDQFGSMLGLP